MVTLIITLEDKFKNSEKQSQLSSAVNHDLEQKGGIDKDFSKLYDKGATFEGQVANGILENKKVNDNNLNQVIVQDAISTFMKHINSRNYEAAFKMLNKEYTSDFDINLSFFQAKYKFNSEMVFEIKDYIDYGDRIIANVIINEKALNYQLNIIRSTFTIYKEENGIYTLADKGIKKTEVIDYKSEPTKLLSANIAKKIILVDGVAYMINITNKSRNEMFITGGEYSIFANYNSTIYPHKPINKTLPSYIISSGSINKYIVEFLNINDVSSISLKVKSKDIQEQNFTIYRN